MIQLSFYLTQSLHWAQDKVGDGACAKELSRAGTVHVGVAGPVRAIG
jgi:hypothetical protein